MNPNRGRSNDINRKDNLKSSFRSRPRSPERVRFSTTDQLFQIPSRRQLNQNVGEDLREDVREDLGDVDQRLLQQPLQIDGVNQIKPNTNQSEFGISEISRELIRLSMINGQLKCPSRMLIIGDAKDVFDFFRRFDTWEDFLADRIEQLRMQGYSANQSNSLEQMSSQNDIHYSTNSPHQQTGYLTANLADTQFNIECQTSPSISIRITPNI